MLRVALIDDESLVLKGMAMVLKKETNIELIGTAQNGQEGLELIFREKPDVVLTDIRMPGLTGLDMIERAQSQFPDMLFIIFSGFNEFKYVQKAIGLGVLDYLEKPVTVAALKQVLEKASKILEYKKNYIRMKERASQINRVMIEQALYKLIHEPAEMEEECIKSLGEAGENLQYSTEIAVLCAGKIFRADTGADEYRQLIHEMTFSVVENHSVEVFTLSVDEGLYFVYFNQECQIFPFYENIQKCKRNLEEQGICFYAGMGNICQNVYELKNSFGEARNALAYAEFLEEDKIVRIDEVEYQNHISSGLTDDPYSISLNFRLGNYKECRRQVCEYINGLKSSLFMPEILRHECLEILYLLQKLAGEKENAQSLRRMDETLYKEIGEFTSAKEILNWTNEKANAVIDIFDGAEDKQGEMSPVCAAKKYIDDHYAESLTLELLAEQVNLNPAYLSVIFKRDEGISYSRYLTGVRMEHAKRLLEKGMKAKDVCEKVGYYDYRYFNKQFKVYMGMTPDTYKRSRFREI